jgi:hypothetical protein
MHDERCSHLLLDYLSRNKNTERPLDHLLQCKRQLEFDFLEGAEKGQLIRRFREEFAKEFEKYSDYPAKVLKGKNSVRLLRAVANPGNAKELVSWVRNFIKNVK